MMSTFIPRRIGVKIPLAIAIFGCAVALVIAHQLPQRIETFVRQGAIAEALTNVDQIKNLRAYYTKHVVEPVVTSSDLEAHYDHESDENRIPLPATMVHDLSLRFSKTGRRLSLFSEYPFPNRAGRKLDDFEHQSWRQFLTGNIHQISKTELIEGREILRVAVADSMTESACVECHNAHPESPKRDWEIGDLRGVLELQVDLTDSLQAARQFSWAVATVLIVISLAGSLGLFVYMRRMLLSPIEQISSAALAYAGGDFSGSMKDTARNDEIGALVNSLNVFRKQSEEVAAARVVQESERRLREILDTGPIGITVVDDATGERLYINRRLVNMLGADAAEDLNTQAVAESFVDRDVQQRIYKALREGQAVENTEVERRRLDGSTFWSLISQGTISDFEGRDARVVWVVDIDAQKRAEAEVAEQGSILQVILENINQAVVLFDKDQRMVTWNANYPDFLCISPDTLKPGLLSWDFTYSFAERGIYGDGDPMALTKDRMDRLWNGTSGTDINFGDERFFDVQSTMTPEGGLVITYTEISERKKAERIIAQALALINESIQYASRIQRSVLPDPEKMAAHLGDTLVIWEPKDVVGGDIYLLRECDAGALLMVADCTGHGVPGAFMTMVATGALDQALIEIPSGDPAMVMKRMNQLVKSVLSQDTGEGESDDGYECGLCRIDATGRVLTFAGARFELWSLKDGEFKVTKGDRAGIGYRRTDLNQDFSNHDLPINKGTTYYLSTDGLVDQVGGVKRRAYGKRRLKESILGSSRMKMPNQAAHILRAFREYQHNEERRDDITLVGFNLDL